MVRDDYDPVKYAEDLVGPYRKFLLAAGMHLALIVAGFVGLFAGQDGLAAAAIAMSMSSVAYLAVIRGLLLRVRRLEDGTNPAAARS